MASEKSKRKELQALNIKKLEDEFGGTQNDMVSCKGFY
jgi:hypothetical protein